MVVDTWVARVNSKTEQVLEGGSFMVLSQRSLPVNRENFNGAVTYGSMDPINKKS
jgi:hypothetical protein